MADKSPVRARALISGRVQGVFFRHQTARAARARLLGGWVRNLADGRVEAVFEGPRNEVEALLRWAETGPPSARVDAVEVRWEPPTGEVSFRIRP